MKYQMSFIQKEKLIGNKKIITKYADVVYLPLNIIVNYIEKRNLYVLIEDGEIFIKICEIEELI